MIAEARAAAEAGRADEAMAAAERIVREFPSAPGSSEALILLAEAALEIGAYDEAAAAGARHAALFPDGDPRADRGRLLIGVAFLGAGRAREGVASLLRLSYASPDLLEQALRHIDRAVVALGTEELRELASTEAPGVLLAPLITEIAVAHHLDGEGEAARSQALRSLDIGATGEARRVAEAVRTGNLEAALDGVVIGAILPRTGSPSVRTFASLVEEGMRVAVARAQRETRRPIRLRIEDDPGGAFGQESVVSSLEQSGVVAVVGPLLDDALGAAARARRGPLPMISPAARTVPEALAGVYSLQGLDPGAARAIAAYAVRAGLRRVSAIFPRSPEGSFEVEVFQRAYSDAGGVLEGRISYDPGITHFQDQLLEAASYEPQAVFLPLPPRDVEILAPQFTFFGLDSLGIAILGTAGWTVDEVVRGVDPRHTDGVIAVSAEAPATPSEAHMRFVSEYETLLRRSLRSSVPALGYDAVGLIVAAWRGGARSPEEVRRALDRIHGYQGATGVLSVREGHIVREHQLVRIEGRTLESVPDPGT